ncbi:MAG: hypothetical protein OEX02_13380 [Cyclobacteriaceae bacterium]|nr:hypothetical protein [Cyclobacteriaceae bacterium]
MKISGFTYIRNGLTYGYPFIPSIKSLLPVVDELIVVVGDSTDGTREAIMAINDAKIRIIDSVWDEEFRISGKIFAQQSNLGLDNISGDWAFHIQADEVLHETAPEKIKEHIIQADKIEEVEGLIFPYYHFWGDYSHIRNTRSTHRYEVRAFKNVKGVRSYRDSQGFRKYKTDNQDEDGQKLNVLKADVPIYHYSYTRNPNLMKQKTNYFHRFWHNDEWVKKNTTPVPFDFNRVDKLELFEGTHPKYMKETIGQKDWDFEYDPTKSNMRLKYKLLHWIEKRFGYRLFEYKNYKLIKGR